MIEKQYKLGEDMHINDAIFPEITFDEIITTLHCNEQVIDRKAIQRVISEIMDIRTQDFDYILNNNIAEIIAEVKKRRN
jgi:hypothetical protein